MAAPTFVEKSPTAMSATLAGTASGVLNGNAGAGSEANPLAEPPLAANASVDENDFDALAAEEPTTAARAVLEA